MSGAATDGKPATDGTPATALGTAAERLRRTALEVAGLGVVRFDLTAGTVTRDARAAIIAGREPHELGPYAFGELFERVHPDDLPVVKAALEAGAAGKRRESRFRWVRPGGEPRNILAVSEPDWAGVPGAGAPAGLVVTIRDVTDENRLARLDVRLRRLFETDMLGIFFYRYDGSIEETNDAFLRMVGFTRADFAAGAVDWAALTPPEFVAQDAAKVAEVRATGQCEPFEKAYVGKDGRQVPVLVGAAGVDDDGGVAYVLDLTERDRLRREWRAVSEQRQIAFDAAKMGVCRVDFIAGTFAPDRRGAEMFGLDPGAGPRPLPELIGAVHEADRADVLVSLNAVREGRWCERQFRVVRPDGSVRTLRTAGRPEWPGPQKSGTPTGMTAALRDVTDLVEQTRRTALLAEVLENTPDLVGAASVDGVAEFMNRAGRELLGLSEDELAGTPIRSMHTDDANARLAEIGLPTAAREGRWTGETELLARDGRVIPVSQSIVGHRDDGGQVTHFSTICRDLTDRVRAEAVNTARRECLSRLAAGEALTDVLPVLARAAEDHLPTPNLVCILLRGGATGDVTDSAAGGGALPGETLKLAAAPSLPDTFKEGIDDLAADETGGACGAAAFRNERVIVENLATDPLCAQFREFTESHNLRAVWSTPIRAAGGHVLGTFAVYHDHARLPTADDVAVVDPLVNTAAVVVERAAADARADRLRRELAEGEARFRGTFENVGVGVAHVGFDGSWLRVNRRLCEIVGYSEEELRASTFQKITHDDDLSTDLAQFGRLMRGDVDSYTLRKRYVRKDGSTVAIQLTVSLQRDADGKSLYALSVIDDVTELARQEEELRDLNATLELKVAARTTRVREQKARLERLARGLADAEARERRRLAHAVHDDLQQILAAAKFSAKLAGDAADPVAELLDEAIDEARDLTQDLVPTVLYDRGPVPAVAALCRRFGDRFGADVTLVGGGGTGGGPPTSDLLPKHYPHGPLLYQAARELLFNAVKHAPGAPVEVALSLTGGRVRLAVSNPDPPAGAAAAPTRSRADLYADPAAEAGGDAGFGLFSLREQTTLVGGTLRAGPAPGGGFRATATLPGLSMDDSQSSDGPDDGPGAADGRPAGGLRVMIVDDHRIVRSALAGLLRGSAGIEVVGEAADGQEAVDRVEEYGPDAVVMDVTMPRMDGIEATRRVKELLPGVRVVGLSMHTRDDMAEAMCAAGAEAYVPKGGPPEELLRALRGNPDPTDCCDGAGRA